MSQPHFIHTIMTLNQRCPNDHLRHFASVVKGREKKIIYYNQSYIMVVSMLDSQTRGVRVTVRAPHHSLLAEQGVIERSMGVTTQQSRTHA
ncbi:hypothetical protein [Aliidiomarina quisquiliarum]|uniref:hypothetical protein n=1 Tax=Aliidiomarina quisquiliarum TaxID=2938947 RepID=UPI00208E5950|nr:hypothetical protein [Aliidiomarina quisquiliarum]MCO4320019.1 hypothetical protein [Aliidiomarina quisquiliarum]